MNNQKVPKIRFKGFSGDWEQRKVGELTNVLSASRVHKEEWAEDGVPFFRSSDVVSAFKGTDNEKAFISFDLYEQLAKSSGKLEQNDILITGGGSIGIPYIVPDNKPLYSKDADLIWIKHSDKFDSRYLYTYFTSEGFRRYLSSISHTGTIAHYTIEQVKDTPVELSSIDEQKTLGEFFDNLNSLITLHQSKLDKLKTIKKSMLENCFPKNGEKVPKIRFSGFTDDWEQRKFSEIAQRESTAKKSSTDFPSVEYEDVVSEVGILNKDVRLKETQKTGICFDGSQVLYGKLRPYLHNWLSPDFSGVAVGDWWVLKPVNVDKSFLFRLIQTEKFDDIANQSSGSKMPRADWNLLSNTEFMVPAEIEEERKIGQYFSELDHLITLHQRKYEKLQIIKKSMLENCFPKNGEKVPKIRFSGFTGDWEQRKLGDIADVTKLAGFEFTEHVVYSDKGNIIALRGLNIKNGQLVLDDVKYIDGSNFAKLNRSKLFIDDIMFTYVGTVGEVAIIKENDRFYLAPNVSRIRVQSNDSSKFISHYMRTDSFYRHVIFPLIATSSQPALSMENIRKFEICLPKNRDEQDKLSEFFDGIDNLITLHQSELEKLQKIKKSLLERMFV